MPTRSAEASPWMRSPRWGSGAGFSPRRITTWRPIAAPRPSHTQPGQNTPNPVKAQISVTRRPASAERAACSDRAPLSDGGDTAMAAILSRHLDALAGAADPRPLHAPAALAEQRDRRRQRDAAHERDVEQDRGREAEAHLLHVEQPQRREDGEDRDHHDRRARDRAGGRADALGRRGGGGAPGAARLPDPLEHEHRVVHRQPEQDHEREQRQPAARSRRSTRSRAGPRPTGAGTRPPAGRTRAPTDSRFEPDHRRGELRRPERRTAAGRTRAPGRTRSRSASRSSSGPRSPPTAAASPVTSAWPPGAVGATLSRSVSTAWRSGVPVLRRHRGRPRPRCCRRATTSTCDGAAAADGLRAALPERLRGVLLVAQVLAADDEARAGGRARERLLDRLLGLHHGDVGRQALEAGVAGLELERRHGERGQDRDRDHERGHGAARDDARRARPRSPSRRGRGRRRRKRGSRPLSIRSPSSASMAGSTVSEPSTAIATTSIVARPIEMNTPLPESSRPPSAIITVSPETSDRAPDRGRGGVEGCLRRRGRRGAPRVRGGCRTASSRRPRRGR